MEFPFNINNLLEDGLSVVDRGLTPCRSTLEAARQRKDELKTVIDEMGKASAKAQSLHGPITSASRLALSSHRMYVKKDADANNGKGAVIGFLKVGSKKLFVYDLHGVQHELEPTCVLDFYVCESCQRQGSGRQLFDFMLQREGVHPVELAIDRPSAKCLSFLARHYNLTSVIPQVNNFVVFNGFFTNQSALKQGRQANNISADPLARQKGSTENRSWLGDGASGDIRNFNRNNSQFEIRQTNQLRTDPLDTRVDAHCILPDIPRLGSSQLKNPNRPSSGMRQAQQPTLSGMGAHHALYSRHLRNSPLEERNNLPGTSASPQVHQRASSPPILQRGGPSAEYLKLTGGHVDYLSRRGGHLTLGPQSPSRLPDTSFCNIATDQKLFHQRKQDTSFNIFGIPKQPLKSVNASPPYRRTALW